MSEPTRRHVLTQALRLGAAGILTGASGLLWWRRKDCAAADRCARCAAAKSCTSAVNEPSVWQIDPKRCVQCGRCATACVQSPSAVKCVHAFKVCGYCDLCFAYFRPGTMEFDTGAEKQLCPTFALTRRFIEAPYYEYTVDEARCIGCAKCVKGCETFGNGSLYLQIRHDRCVHCNECAIARACPARAITRIPAREAYRLKGEPKKE